MHQGKSHISKKFEKTNHEWNAIKLSNNIYLLDICSELFLEHIQTDKAKKKHYSSQLYKDLEGDKNNNKEKETRLKKAVRRKNEF